MKKQAVCIGGYPTVGTAPGVLRALSDDRESLIVPGGSEFPGRILFYSNTERLHSDSYLCPFCSATSVLRVLDLELPVPSETLSPYKSSMLHYLLEKRIKNAHNYLAYVLYGIFLKLRV